MCILEIFKNIYMEVILTRLISSWCTNITEKYIKNVQVFIFSYLSPECFLSRFPSFAENTQRRVFPFRHRK